MGKDTAIEWTDITFNPWWGCANVSPGCANCYAETWAKRTGYANTWGARGERRMFGDKHWAEPVAWNRKAESAGRPALVFCASMADVFEEHPAVERPRERLWKVIAETPWLVWQLLTKRPENIRRMVPLKWLDEPPENVWYGTSVEDQQRADERIPILLGVPGVVHFLSAEPLLGPIDLKPERWLDGWDPNWCGDSDHCSPRYADGPFVDLVIAGGESGPGARPMSPNWVRSLRDQCVDAIVPFFFKQWGEWVPLADREWMSLPPGDRKWAKVGDVAMVRVGKKAAGRELDGRTWDELPDVRCPALQGEL